MQMPVDVLWVRICDGHRESQALMTQPLTSENTQGTFGGKASQHNKKREIGPERVWTKQGKDAGQTAREVGGGGGGGRA